MHSSNDTVELMREDLLWGISDEEVIIFASQAAVLGPSFDKKFAGWNGIKCPAWTLLQISSW